MRLFLFVCILLLTGCVNRVEDINHTFSFFDGVWHGFIIMFSTIAYLFNNDIEVYAENHSEYYNIGYYIGLSLFFKNFGG